MSGLHDHHFEFRHDRLIYWPGPWRWGRIIEPDERAGIEARLETRRAMTLLGAAAMLIAAAGVVWLKPGWLEAVLPGIGFLTLAYTPVILLYLLLTFAMPSSISPGAARTTDRRSLIDWWRAETRAGPGVKPSVLAAIGGVLFASGLLILSFRVGSITDAILAVVAGSVIVTRAAVKSTELRHL